MTPKPGLGSDQPGFISVRFHSKAKKINVQNATGTEKSGEMPES
jgi:hypothetical protein